VSQPLKILLAVHHFLPNYTAGAELHAYYVAQWLQQHHYDVHLICIEHINKGPADGVIWEDDEYQGLPVRRLSFDLSQTADPFEWQYNNPWLEKHLTEYLAQLKPDIFHLISGYLMGAGAIRAAYSLNVPTVITLTDFWFVCPRLNLLRPDGTLSPADHFNAVACARCKFEEQRRFRLLAQFLPDAANWIWRQALSAESVNWKPGVEFVNKFERRNDLLMSALKQADALICPSRFLLETFIARGVAPERLIFNSHGLNDAEWLPVDNPLNPPERPFRIGYMGQIGPQKGVHILIEAYKALKTNTHTELVIYGNHQADPPYTRHLRQLIGAHPSIKLMGKYAPQQAAQILSQIDALVIPSTWNEIGPLVMYEALHTKTPVIASNIPNMSYVIQHEANGLLFESGSHLALAEQLQRLIETPALVKNLVAGIQPVKTIAEEMNTIKTIYHTVANREPVEAMICLEK